MPAFICTACSNMCRVSCEEGTRSTLICPHGQEKLGRVPKWVPVDTEELTPLTASAATAHLRIDGTNTEVPCSLLVRGNSGVGIGQMVGDPLYHDLPLFGVKGLRAAADLADELGATYIGLALSSPRQADGGRALCLRLEDGISVVALAGWSRDNEDLEVL